MAASEVCAILGRATGQVAEVEMADSRTVKTVSLRTIRKYDPALVGIPHSLERERPRQVEARYTAQRPKMQAGGADEMLRQRQSRVRKKRH